MFDVIIAANGLSVRMGFDKLSADIGTTTVLQRTVNAFKNIPDIAKIILVSDAVTDMDGVVCVCGGSTRQESVAAGLKEVTAEYVLIHDGARPFVTADLIVRVMDSVRKFGSGVPCIKSADSIRIVEDGKITDSIDRELCALVQTPQGFKSALIKQAFERAALTRRFYTDESEIVATFLEPCHIVEGDPSNKKITTPQDLYGTAAKIGTGFDVHRFTENKPLKLCGVEIPYKYGLLAHSDGDAALHAVMDALLTAIGERDIGVLFPDTDPQYADADSTELLKTVLKKVSPDREIISVNLTIIAQTPKLSPYIEKMRLKLAALLNISPSAVSISATTTENLGLIGDGKALAALAAAVVI